MKDYVIVKVGSHAFGIDADVVQDVFYPRNVTHVPLAGTGIVGVLNLRGRIVTAVCARARLGMPAREAAAPEPKAVGMEILGDNYGLVVDHVESVIKLDPAELTPAPNNLPPRWAELIAGVFKLPDGLIVVIDAVRLLAPPATSGGLAA
jgi:purine-binding chemotaxis protein CheW